jgi:hypothetical protein
MRPWTRNALVFGGASAVVTLGVNWIGSATATGDACHRSSPLGFVGFVVFLGLMGAAGYMTTRGGDSVGMASIAGLVGALISAIGTIIGFAIIFSSISAQCVSQNNTGLSSQQLLTTGGIAAGILTSLIGLGIGAGVGAIGGLIGRGQTAPTAS